LREWVVRGGESLLGSAANRRPWVVARCKGVYHERVAGEEDGEAVDVEIYEALRKGDREAAFKRLQRRHGRILFDVANKILGDRARAEDVMQETLIKAYETIETLKDPRRLGAWLKKIAQNKSIDVGRAEKRANTHQAALARDAADAESPPALESLSSQEEQRALQDCLGALPMEKRAAVVGRFRSDLEYRDLAEAGGENVDTVRIRVARALLEA
jgi:RNA polymerase sigma-70 factor, ECF subfamily